MIDIAQIAPETIWLAEDEASLYLQATLMRVWSPVGQTPQVRVDTQRDMVHFYGCLNLATGEETAMPAKTMNAETTVLFLQQVSQRYPDQPILLLWDRATWHGGQAVENFLAANPRIQVMKFPAGSPELNPQEHIWKLTREKVSHNHLIPKLNVLAEAFESHLANSVFKSTFLDKYGYSSICPMFN
jgi:transposase